MQSEVDSGLKGKHPTAYWWIPKEQKEAATQDTAVNCTLQARTVAVAQAVSI